ncbi:MAG: putative major head protein [Podoviridae sp. ctcf755]|nr:MAG: putative major head protein [Podoviridae sp. ctcf755]
MPNEIQTAINYLNNDEEIDRIFAARSFTYDWLKPNVAVGARTVKYRQTSFRTNTLGDFDREDGYTRIDIISGWVEKTLTQDKGNTILIDKMDSEEAQGIEIVTQGKKFDNTIAIPYTDKYNIQTVATTEGVKTNISALTKDNIENELDKDLDYLFNTGVAEAVVLNIKTSAARKLKQSAKSTGSISLGNWNGDLSAEVKVYGDSVKAKIKEIPDQYFPSNVDYILAPNAAIAFMIKYQETVYHDKIPGYGNRRHQLDRGLYFDCWVEPGAEKAVIVHKSSETASQSSTQQTETK